MSFALASRRPPRSELIAAPGRRLLLLLVASASLLLGACESGGHFTLFGYTTRPQYDPNIHTVYVPIFKNLTFWKGLEFELTEAVVREIQAKTPFKVVSCQSGADAELTGTIISLNKGILNRNPLNEVREAETTLAVEVVWRDLRTGEILSRPRPPGPPLAAPSLPPADILPDETPPPAPGAPPPPPPPVLVQSIAGFIPELSESLTTAQKKNVDRLAVQIVSMMELPW